MRKSAIRRPHFINMSRLLADRAWRVSQLREWLASAPAYGGLTADDIETLSNDPPLPFFILFEAMQQPRGERSAPWAARIDHCVGSDFRRARIAIRDSFEAAQLACRGSSPISPSTITRQMFLQDVPEI